PGQPRLPRGTRGDEGGELRAFDLGSGPGRPPRDVGRSLPLPLGGEGGGEGQQRSVPLLLVQAPCPRARHRLAAATQPAICARELNPSLFRMLRTWLSTVRSEMKRRAPICLLLRPSATRRATSTSRFASTPDPASFRIATLAWSGSPSATATALSRLSLLPALNSASNLGLPSAAIADSSAWVITGLIAGMMTAPAP